ncbi:MAG: PspC domain-containing protein [Chlorobi bacterium]|nr:PspC domain-containing protein [Chlorobiota bacterium]
MATRLYRSRTDRKIAGVCGGIAEYFDMDPSLIRILFVVLIFFNGFGLLAYVICWIVIPEAPLGQVIVEPGNAEELALVPEQSSFKPHQPVTKWTIGMGALLIAIGFAILIGQLIPWFNTENIMPYIFIAAGILVLYRGWRNRQRQAQSLPEETSDGT